MSSRSILIETVAPKIFEIRGCTHPHTALLKEHGCEWQSKRLSWKYEGEKLPTALQQLADGVYGLETLRTGVLAPQVTTTPKTLETAIAPKPRKKATPKKSEPKVSISGTFAATGRVTPLRQYYLDIKSCYPKHILLFQIGDFFESFDDDAAIVADVCDLVLTQRPVAKGAHVPMSGFPLHTLTQYLQMLVKAGHNVAVATHDKPLAGETIAERKVTKIVNGEPRS